MINFENGLSAPTDNQAASSTLFDTYGLYNGAGGSGDQYDATAQASFEITAQNLNAGFQSDESAQEEIYLEIDSARAGSDLLVEADGLDDDEIVEVFDDEFKDGDNLGDVNEIYDATNTSAKPGNPAGFDNSLAASDNGDGVVFEGVNSDANITANFSEVDTGDYEFSFEVTDTGVSDSSSVSVTEEDDINAEILRGGVATAAQGDFAVIPIELEETDEAYVNLGFNDVNFNATAKIEDGNDDGLVTLEVNSYLVGRDDSGVKDFLGTRSAVGLSSGEAYANYSLREGLSVAENQDSVSVTLDNSDKTGMRTLDKDGSLSSGSDPGIDGPMEPDQYDVNVTSDGEELDVGTVQIVEPQVTDIKSWTMSGDLFSDVDEDETAELYEYVENGELTRDNSIAEGDVLVYQIQSTSMFGALKATEATIGDYSEALTAITGYDNTGISDFKLSVEQTDDTTAANQNPKKLVLSENTGNAMKVVPDERNSSLFVVLNEDNAALTRNDISGDSASGANLGMSDGEAYTANWTVFERSDLGDGQYATDDASIEERSIDFDTDQGDVIRVAASQGQTISGSTSVAPGTELNIRLRSTGDSPFLEDTETIVSENGTFSTEFDLSDRAQNASFLANAQGFDEDYETPGVIGDAPTADITFDDQTVDEGTVEVSGTMSEGGFVAIHSGSASGEVIGNSEYLSPGEFTTEVEISPLSNETTLVAMAHMDTNDNEAYDFTGGDSADGPYVLNGSAVVDSASVSPEDTAPVDTTEDPSDTTDEPVDTTEDPSDTTDAPADTEAETTTADGPGFTAVLALIALVAAALLAVRRRD